MIALAIGIAYSLVGQYAWRRFTWLFMQDPITERGEALFGGLIAGLFWPISLTWLVLYRSADSFALAPRSERSKRRERALEDRIAELERELNVR